MKNGKKVIVVITIILSLLLIGVGAFAYIYLATDLLKTDKEMFFTYLRQLTSEDGFIDPRIQQYNEMKNQNAYENSGEVKVKVTYPEESLEKVIEKVNDLSIRLSGKSDMVNQKVEQNIEVDYGNDVIFPINYKQDGNKFGLQTDELSKQYIAIRNQNLDEFLAKFGIEIPESVELSSIEQENIFTDEEIEQLKQIYLPVLEQQLLNEYFTSAKTEVNVSYTLELSLEQIKNIIIKILEATKQNTLVIDKINEIMLKYNTEAQKIEISDIDVLIKSINEEEIPATQNLKIIFVQNNNKLNQIYIQLGENQISIRKNNVQNTLEYDINCEVKEETKEESDSLPGAYELSFQKNNVYFNVKYTGLENLNNIQENYKLGFSISDDELSLAYDYEINNNTQFIDEVAINGLDEKAAVYLNDHEATVITNFLTQVKTKLFEINKNQMAKLGLEEDENPLIYSNPITMLENLVSNMTNENIEQETNTSEPSEYSEGMALRTDIKLEEKINIEIPAEFSEGSWHSEHGYEYIYDTNGNGLADTCRIAINIPNDYKDSNKLINDMAKYYSASDSVKKININNIEWVTFIRKNELETIYYCSTTHEGDVYLMEYSIGTDVAGETEQYIQALNKLLKSITFK